LSALACGILAILSGCSPPVIAPLYGPAVIDYDPSVELADFTYEPAGPIHVGDKLTFTATLNKQVDPSSVSVIAEIGSEAAPLAGSGAASIVEWLNDQGYDGDGVAGDGIWTAELTWSPEYGTQQDVPVSGHLQWANGFANEAIHAAPLTVLPGVE
jgi:hypothetical protein